MPLADECQAHSLKRCCQVKQHAEPTTARHLLLRPVLSCMMRGALPQKQPLWLLYSTVLLSRMVFSHDGTRPWPVALQAPELAGSAAQAQAYMDTLLQGTLSSKVIPAALHASAAGSASACGLLSQAAAGLQGKQTGAAIQSASLLLNMPPGTQVQCHPASCWQ